MKDIKKTIPFNLQFFAEPTTEPQNDPEPQNEPTPEPKDEPELSAEEQLQQMRVEMAKLKKATDKATSEAADYKKQLRAKQSADEVAAQEKAEKEAEREAKFEELLKENTITKFEKNYLSLGYSQELATKAATAQYENDTDALFKVQKDFQEAFAKQKESEWLKTRPTATVGVGEEKTTVTKEQFDRMGYMQRVEFAEKYPDTYKSYTK